MNKLLSFAAAGVVSAALLSGGCDSETATSSTGGTPSNTTPSTPPPDSGPSATPKPGDAGTGAAPTADDKAAKEAMATIEPSKAPGDDNIAGTVRFMSTGTGVKVNAEITGLKPDGKHGFHIHEKGDLSDPALASAGAHFNPGGHKHGGPEGTDRHGGDLGNLQADADGKAMLEVTIDGLTIDGAENGVVGKSVIVHEKEDDLKTDPSGNSGARIGGGVIEVMSGASAPAENAQSANGLTDKEEGGNAGGVK